MEPDKVDSYSQSVSLEEQSCQCCECRDIGVLTASNTGTTTEEGKPNTEANIQMTQGTEESEPETETFESALGLEQKETETNDLKSTEAADAAVATSAMVKTSGKT